MYRLDNMSRSKKITVSVICLVLGILAIIYGYMQLTGSFYFGIAVILLAVGLTISSVFATVIAMKENVNEHLLQKP